MFFFPETMLERMKKIEADVRHLMPVNRNFAGANGALKQFNARCKEYLGLGYLASFIPTTNAFKARKALSVEIDDIMPTIEYAVNRIPNLDEERNVALFHRWKQTTALSGVITNILFLGPLWGSISEDFFHHFQLLHIARNRNTSFLRLISMFPLINNIFYVDGERKPHFYSLSIIAKRFAHDLLNAFRIVDGALYFLHQLVNKILEIGAEKNHSSNVVRVILKGIVSIVFFAAALPVKAAMKTIDACYSLLANIICRPVGFMCASIYAKWSNRNTATAIAANAHAQEQALLIDPATRSIYSTFASSQSRSQSTYQQGTEADEAEEMKDDFQRRLDKALDELDEAESDSEVSEALGTLKDLKLENEDEHERYINKSEYSDLYEKYPGWEMKPQPKFEDGEPERVAPASPR